MVCHDAAVQFAYLFLTVNVSSQHARSAGNISMFCAFIRTNISQGTDWVDVSSRNWRIVKVFSAYVEIKFLLCGTTTYLRPDHTCLLSPDNIKIQHKVLKKSDTTLQRTARPGRFEWFPVSVFFSLCLMWSNLPGTLSPPAGECDNIKSLFCFYPVSTEK